MYVDWFMNGSNKVGSFVSKLVFLFILYDFWIRKEVIGLFLIFFGVFLKVKGSSWSLCICFVVFFLVSVFIDEVLMLWLVFFESVFFLIFLRNLMYLFDCKVLGRYVRRMCNIRFLCRIVLWWVVRIVKLLILVWIVKCMVRRISFVVDSERVIIFEVFVFEICIIDLENEWNGVKLYVELCWICFYMVIC